MPDAWAFLIGPYNGIEREQSKGGMRETVRNRLRRSLGTPAVVLRTERPPCQ